MKRMSNKKKNLKLEELNPVMAYVILKKGE